MKSKSLILSTGLAMFSMFFGSGNLVFPLVVGQMSDGHYLTGAFGIFLTGVLVPFLGILAILLFNGSAKEFFGRLGKPATFWLPLIALSLMGPFGVLARCITVAHGAFKLIVPNTPLWVFSALSCAILFFLTIRKNRIVPVLGVILTPILLVSLLLIGIFGLYFADWPSAANTPLWDSFKTGILQGYQTMDLLAAFFFSAFVIKHLQTKQNEGAMPSEPKKTLPIFLKASFIGAGLLSLVYVVLVLLGAIYAPELGSIAPQEMLAYIAHASLGPFAAPVVCIAVILACLTTSVVLTSLFADFLKKEVAKDKIGNGVALAVTLCIAFFISTLEFSGIAKIIGPILEAVYPALIVLTVLSIFHKLWGWRWIRFPFAIAFFTKLFLRFS